MTDMEHLRIIVMQRTIAPVTSSRLFQSTKSASKPTSTFKDVPLSNEAQARQPASLKASGAALATDGSGKTIDIISLSTGRPHPRYYPFESVDFAFTTVTTPPSGNEQTAKVAGNVRTARYDIAEQNAAIDLSVALSYGYSAGSEQLIKFLTEHIEAVHDPPYSDWDCALTVGSTSALDLAIRTLSEPGDSVLVEEYTYSGMIECLKPLNRKIVAVPMDQGGLCPDALDTLLMHWDTTLPKPRLLYTIPTGQNPTGITQNMERRRQIHKVAEKHNLLVLEDDPYGYLRFTEDKLPSYLSLDTSGRVLRFDSTSKTLSPGLRCAWMTGQTSLIQRFLHLHDVSIVSPSGVSQLMMYKLLGEVWGHEGFSSWLRYLRAQYRDRMLIMAKACETYLPEHLCSWDLPEAGMFFWLKIHWDEHAMARSSEEDISNIILAIEDQLYNAALEQGVLCCKGSFFNARDVQSDLYVRLTFVTASKSEIVEAIQRFAKAVKLVFDQS